MGAALNWVQSPNNNQGGWGSSFSYVIGTDGSMGTVLDDDQMPTYSAGYGGAGTYAIDEYGISYELAQSQAQEPFTDALYERLAKEVAGKCLKYGIPPVMVSIMVQKGEVPMGIVRHDRCENGIKLGKTDPGVQFNEVRFIADVKAEMEDDMTSEEKARMDTLFSQVSWLRAELGLPPQFDNSQAHESTVMARLDGLDEHTANAKYHHLISEIETALGGSDGLTAEQARALAKDEIDLAQVKAAR